MVMDAPYSVLTEHGQIDGLEAYHALVAAGDRYCRSRHH
jgi:hypothetical protein